MKDQIFFGAKTGTVSNKTIGTNSNRPLYTVTWDAQLFLKVHKAAVTACKSSELTRQKRTEILLCQNDGLGGRSKRHTTIIF